MNQRIRQSKQALYDKIYTEYKNKNNTIDNPKKIISGLEDSNKDIKHILCVVKGIRYGLINNKASKQTIEKYNKSIKKLMKYTSDDDNKQCKWYRIIRNVEYYITYRTNMRQYKRNKCIALLCTCVYPESASLLLSLKYAPTSQDINDNENYYIRSINQLYIDKRFIDLDPKLYKALNEYCDNLKPNDLLFTCNLSRFCKIIENVVGFSLTEIREEYIKLH